MVSELTLEVSETIEFQVTTEKQYADSYGTGDYVGHNKYVVKRKLMLSDIPKCQGGTKDRDIFHSDRLLLKWEKEGLDVFGTFRDKRIAQILCDALNSKEQKELIEIVKT